MHVKKKKENGWLFGVLMGTGFAIFLTVGFTAVLAILILDESVGKGRGEMLIIPLLAISVFVGGELTKKICNISDIRLPVIVMGTYILITVTTGLMIDGGLQNIWTNLLAGSIGCLISCALCIRKNGRKGKRKSGFW